MDLSNLIHLTNTRDFYLGNINTTTDELPLQDVEGLIFQQSNIFYEFPNYLKIINKERNMVVTFSINNVQEKDTYCLRNNLFAKDKLIHFKKSAHFLIAYEPRNLYQNLIFIYGETEITVTAHGRMQFYDFWSVGCLIMVNNTRTNKKTRKMSYAMQILSKTKLGSARIVPVRQLNSVTIHTEIKDLRFALDYLSRPVIEITHAQSTSYYLGDSRGEWKQHYI